MNPMMSKWSARPGIDKASRVRNNQRRHRQRVKDRIADLEERLAETQLQLRRALDQIAELTGQSNTAQSAAEQSVSSVSPRQVTHAAPPEKMNAAQSSPAQQLPDYDEDECCALPPPLPGKSTTRCRDAYIIIAQQNYRALDGGAIRQWLEPGFYGALAEGDGCRVDTKLLFALLDFVSSN